MLHEFGSLLAEEKKRKARHGGGAGSVEDMGGGRRHTTWHAAEWPPSCYGELIRSPPYPRIRYLGCFSVFPRKIPTQCKWAGEGPNTTRGLNTP